MFKLTHVLAASLLTLAGAAQAITITFEDRPNGNTAISGTYQGLSWNNFYSTNSSTGGYFHGRVSGSHDIYNGFGNDASFSAAGGFTLNSLYATGAWNDGLQITLTGSLGGVQKFTQTDTLTATSPTLLSLNWTGIDKVSIHTFGGTHHAGFGGSGTHVAIDNITINEAVANPVPEPETYALMLAGLGVVGFARRRRAA